MLVFLKKRTKTKQNSNAWITTGIKSHVILKGTYTCYVGTVMILNWKHTIGIIAKHYQKLTHQLKRNVLQQ